MKRLIVLALVVAACGGDITETTTDPTDHSLDYFAEVKEITLSNGTLCVVAKNSDKGIAITCDWAAIAPR